VRIVKEVAAVVVADEGLLYCTVKGKWCRDGLIRVSFYLKLCVWVNYNRI